MYSYDDRLRAVKLYIQYGRSAADAIRELGYPSRKNLRRWYRIYVETGDLPERSRPKSKYSIAQKQRAVEYYFTHGRCLARTSEALGYPCVATLRAWIDALHPGTRPRLTGKATGAPFSPEEKRQAVIELCSRQGGAATRSA